MIRFTSHCRLIRHDTKARNDYSVNWDIHTVLNFDDVTDSDMISMKNHNFSVSEDIHLYIYDIGYSNLSNIVKYNI